LGIFRNIQGWGGKVVLLLVMFAGVMVLISWEKVLTMGVGGVIIVAVRGQLAQLVRAPP
jgi:hypothetical protein